ncbi:hypothetical protein Corgl_0508 [Coriobacterium glomerans PW2]|uniref:Uncharacterized protein n=1 Tax=Coriobacterium glomerans (strain ATCC 49209 / DSM 20642 / JCM 10262 / PW2) TaxID=700015 RepID=F2NB89_CORGP|nr:hypothetical protein [Coriobacterium glomerans]AEB06625.1 hypothetical protein Corgl_0508 [Coriobacterium glomerans PW2]
MSDEIDNQFIGDPGQLRAYEDFCRAQRERPEEGFALGEPALICRWRMVGASVPALARHLRALRARRVNGRALPAALIAWVGQHIELSLDRGTENALDGVVMLVVDVDGSAAMSTGPYAPLADESASALRARAMCAASEANASGVAPEVLCLSRGEVLQVCTKPAGDQSDNGASTPLASCGCLTLVEQLAAMRGHRIERIALADADDVDRSGANGEAASVFLVSDEHGIVAASDAVPDTPAQRRDAAFISFLQECYSKLLRAASGARGRG